MSERIEQLWNKPDSDELFDAIDDLCNKTFLHNSDVLNLLLEGFSIHKKK